MEIGRYYLNRKDYTGAINRFKVVVTKYQTTRQVEEALERLTEAYMALGIVGEAQTAAAVLGPQFPRQRLVQARLPAGEVARPGAQGRHRFLDQQGLPPDRREPGLRPACKPLVRPCVKRGIQVRLRRQAILVKISGCGGYWIIRFRG